MTGESMLPTAARPVWWKRPWPLLAAIMVGGWTLVVVISVIVTHGKPTPGDAVVACHNAVEDKLRNPGTADFAWTSENVTPRTGGGWTISGHVDADNDFGAAKRIYYTCEATEGGTVLAANVVGG